MLQGINHIGIAVKDLEVSKQRYAQLFRIEQFHEETIEMQKVRIASFSLNGVLIELTAAISDDSPIAQFIAKRGEGIHHIAFTSNAIEDDLSHAEEQGIRLINQIPVPGAHDMQIAFLHPSSTGGVLMEFCQPNNTDTHE
jgi:methylmalonyl-CoA/ethylmalonyl-CoA epimerase